MKKQIRRSILLFSSLFLTGSVMLLSSHLNASEQSPLSNVYDYKIYYDAPTPALLQKMTNYDLMIIEPVYYSRAQIEGIQEAGTLVYGYINTMEADRWNTDLFNQLNDDDFFLRDGERVYYSEWDSFLTDITSTHYQNILSNEVQKQIVEKGLDGAFLDTVGNIDNEHNHDPQLAQDQREGMASWMSSVKDEHPELSLMQNWGFDTLTTATSPYVDGIMWESFHFSDIVADEWAQDQIYKLRKTREQQGIEVFTVSQLEGSKSTSFARANRFKHYHSPNSYNEW